jgi:hypothetical protein
MSYSIVNQELLRNLKKSMLYEYKNIAKLVLNVSKKMYYYKEIEESLCRIKKNIVSNFLNSLNTINIEEKKVYFNCSIQINSERLQLIFDICKSNFYEDLESNFVVYLFYNNEESEIYRFKTKVYNLTIENIKFLFFSCLDKFENKIKEDKAFYEKYYKIAIEKYQDAKDLVKTNISKYRLHEKFAYYESALEVLEKIKFDIYSEVRKHENT